MKFRNASAKLFLGPVAIVLLAIIAGTYALSTSIGSPAQLGQTDSTLMLALDRSVYSVGDSAKVTLLIENIGGETLTIDNPEQSPILIVCDSNMTQIGIWTVFHKALPMNPPLGPILLSPGQRDSWAFEWDLTFHRTDGSMRYEKLSPGYYNLQGNILLTLSASNLQAPQLANSTSNVIQFSIIQG